MAICGHRSFVATGLIKELGNNGIGYDCFSRGEVKREGEAGYDMIATKLPAVVTVVKLPYEPRYPTIKSKMAAKKKEIPVLSEEDIPSIDLACCGLKGSPTKVKKTYTPVREKNGVKLAGMPAEEAAEQVVKLIYDAKIL